MWVDEGAGQTPDNTAPDQLAISVDGQEYSAELNQDINQDGLEDTAHIDYADGTSAEFTDLDGDGHADQYTRFDSNGNPVQTAQFDEATGQWIATQPGNATPSAASGTPVMTADLEDGDVQLGPATIDSDNDGTPDTAVMEAEDGSTLLFTDTDGDGKADVYTVITPQGEAHTYQHVGDNQWAEVPDAERDAPPPASDQIWSGETNSDAVSGVAKIDANTGQWISHN